MFNIFTRYNVLFFRSRIRGAIREYQTQLIQGIKDDVESLHNRFKVYMCILHWRCMCVIEFHHCSRCSISRPLLTRCVPSWTFLLSPVLSFGPDRCMYMYMYMCIKDSITTHGHTTTVFFFVYIYSIHEFQWYKFTCGQHMDMISKLMKSSLQYKLYQYSSWWVHVLLTKLMYVVIWDLQPNCLEHVHVHVCTVYSVHRYTCIISIHVYT